ncbi:TPA: permease [Streptococcus agalactiae]|uniref:Permease n=2 Tax=Streptococcus agalactiae TaxID=1311 RepID=A0AAW6XVJ0_STRAG|nr:MULTISPECIES: permease [Streptococcus]AYZ22688.1 permease [Streptococcus agalactiae]EAO71988.1 putative ABC transporter, permease protein [Streptococcus agalactiae 515]EMA8743514.1 permease [Streptococcus agalactiae]EPT91552.1 membrane protein [Streptococcus agalactiae BSU188]EPU51191.1 membrane protein [Streptococcus agalactiae GB00002]
MDIFNQLPDSVLQWFAIFISIIIEALPFVLLGTILSGIIEVFITPDIVNKFLPKNKFLRVLFGTFVGFVFPSCECGIIPIINRFLEKQVPSYTAVPFLATAPIINPIVLFATYSAFGNSIRFLILRFVGATIVAIALGVMLAFLVDDNILKEDAKPTHFHDYSDKKWYQKIFLALAHAIDEFFDTGRYLVFGTLIASAMQIYLPTRVLTTIGHSPITAILVMMLLAFILSLCSEADAFIGASLLSTFGIAPVMAFLLIGPMIDIKNLMMMVNSFKTRFIVQFISVSSIIIIIYCLFVGVI